MLNSFQTLQPNSVAPSLYSECDKPSGLGFNFMEQEIWKPINGFEGLYEISSYGNVRRNGKILSPFKTKKGYLRVMLSNKSTKNKYFIHRLVAIAFIPNPNLLNTVNHINFVKSDNFYKNLEWMSVYDNAKDAWVKGKVPFQKGVDAYEATFTKDEVMDIYNSNDTCVNIAKRYNRPYTTIYCIKSGKSYKDITGGISNIKDQYKKNGKYTKSSNN